MYKPTLDEDWELFKNWVKTKNPDETYKWSDPWGCAAGQFHKAYMKTTITNDLYSRISNFARPYETFGELAAALNK